MTSQFTWASALTTGSGHLKDGIPCQDAVGVRVFKSNNGATWLIAVAADGAGSATRAEVGSQAAVTHALDFIEGRKTALACGLLSATLSSAFRFARAKLIKLARDHDLPLRSFATTLNVFVSDGTVSAFAQVGDGIMLVNMDAAGWIYALKPYNGEYANETKFITCHDWHSHLGIGVISEPVSTVLVMTDGLRDLMWKRATDEPMPILDLIHAALRDDAPKNIDGHKPALSAGLQSMIEAPHITEKTDDDTSLVAIAFPEVMP